MGYDNEDTDDEEGKEEILESNDWLVKVCWYDYNCIFLLIAITGMCLHYEVIFLRETKSIIKGTKKLIHKDKAENGAYHY